MRQRAQVQEVLLWNVKAISEIDCSHSVRELAMRCVRRPGPLDFLPALHHVDVSALGRAFPGLKRSAAPGVDGETVASYEQNLAQNLSQLNARVQSGCYQPQPVRRVTSSRPRAA